jgi:hypothetical protein
MHQRGARAYFLQWHSRIPRKHSTHTRKTKNLTAKGNNQHDLKTIKFPFFSEYEGNIPHTNQFAEYPKQKTEVRPTSVRVSSGHQHYPSKNQHTN